MDNMKVLLKPSVEFHGPACTHNMPCAVYRDEPAVLNCNTGIFAPSWKAQKEGYMLVKPPRLLRWFFKKFQV